MASKAEQHFPRFCHIPDTCGLSPPFARRRKIGQQPFRGGSQTWYLVLLIIWPCLGPRRSRRCQLILGVPGCSQRSHATCCTSLCSATTLIPVLLCSPLTVFYFISFWSACRLLSRCPSLQRNLMFQKVALHLHNQHVYLFRRLLRRRAEAQGLSKPFRRRNGWKLKPRQGDPAALVVEAKWWHDNSKSPYWSYFQGNDSYNERSHKGVTFYDEFHMPRVVFDTLHQMFIGVKGFQDKNRGDGGRGMRTQPLLLKVCSLVYILTDGGARPVYRAAQRSCLSQQCVRKFHHAAIAHLYFNHLKQHVFIPRTQEELRESESKYAKCGFPGAFCSFDVVHAAWHQCPHGFTHTCTGKEGFPTLAWTVLGSTAPDIAVLSVACWSTQSNLSNGIATTGTNFRISFA